MHPEKTKIIYCGIGSSEHKDRKFTFLGYDFRRRANRSKQGKVFTGFTPAASTRECRQINLPHKIIHLICTAAK